EEGCLKYDDGDDADWFWQNDGCSCGDTCDDNCGYTGTGICSDNRCSDRCADQETRDWNFESYFGDRDDYDTTDEMKQALYDYGPLAILVDSAPHWQGNEGGIITTGTAYDHEVTLVGWNDADGGYWIIKNSWGSGWGNSGYAKLAYGLTEQFGSAYGISKARAYTGCNPKLSITVADQYTNDSTPSLEGYVKSDCYDVTSVKYIIDPFDSQVHDWGNPDGDAAPVGGGSVFGYDNEYDFDFTSATLSDDRYAVFLDSVNDRDQHCATKNVVKYSFYVDTLRPTAKVSDVSTNWVTSDVVGFHCDEDYTAGTWSGCTGTKYYYFDADGVCSSSKTQYINPLSGGAGYDTITVSDQHDEYLCVWVEDKSGNSHYASSSPNQLKIDKTPPVASISGISSSWTALDTITLSCNDSFGECKQTRWYQTTSGDCSVARSSYTPVTGSTIQLGGDHDDYLCLWVEDKVDQSHTAKSTQTLKIDNSAPVAGIGGVGSVWESEKTVTFDCDDTLSGCVTTFWTDYTSGTTCSTDKGDYSSTSETEITIDTDNNQRLCLWVEDVVGLHDVTISQPLRVDATAPVASITGVSSTWVSSDTVTLGCSDNASGCSAVRRYYYSEGSACSADIGSYQNSITSNTLPITEGHQDYLCLWVEDGAGNHDTVASARLHVDVAPPIAEAGPNQSGITDEAVSFSALGSSDDSGEISSYRWEFGDGGIAYGPSPSHTYTLADDFTATLTVTDPAGNAGIDTAQITIAGRPKAVIDSITPRPAVQGASIDFVGHGLDQDGDIDEYRWYSDLDGQLSTLEAFPRADLSPGTHQITFRVQDDDDLWSSLDSMQLDIYPPPDWTMFHRYPHHQGATRSNVPNTGDQTYSVNWFVNVTDPIASSPAIADLDHDLTNGLEIVFTTRAQTPMSNGTIYAYDNAGGLRWSYPIPNPPLDQNAYAYSSPAIANIDADEHLEIIVGAIDGHVYAIEDIDGVATLQWTYPNLLAAGLFRSSPAVADVTSVHVGLETVIGCDDGFVYALDSLGNMIWFYPSVAAAGYSSSPALADIDSSAGLETIIVSDAGVLEVIDAAGNGLASLALGIPPPGQMHSSPAVAEMRPDWPGTEIAVGSFDTDMYLINYNPSTQTLTTVCSYNSAGPVRSSPAIGFVCESPEGEIVFGSDDDWVYVIDFFCNFRGSSGTADDVFSSPAIGEMRYEQDSMILGAREVVVGSDDMSAYGLSFASWPSLRWTLDTMAEVLSSPAIADIDHDGVLEIAVGSVDGLLYVLDTDDPVQDCDEDTIADVDDNCPYDANEDQINSDTDGHGDVCDNCPDDDNDDQADADGDGKGDTCDNCGSVVNAGQENSDVDSLGDACDNCPQDANEGQADGDLDDAGDTCDNCVSLFNPD
ncbi:MAG: hypothetical protein DRJ50_07210, partial [Actinobacteria bacterium]